MGENEVYSLACITTKTNNRLKSVKTFGFYSMDKFFKMVYLK